MNRDDASSPGGRGNDALNRQVRASTIAPLLPQDFAAAREGSGVRLTVTERDRLNENSSSTTYVFKFASDVDTTTLAGRDAGFARGEICGQVAAPMKGGLLASDFVTNQRFQSGVFFCFAVDGTGKQSSGYLTSQQLSNEVLDTSIPPDVDHEQVSESGAETAPGVVASVLTVSCRMPNPLGSTDRLQLYLQDYTRLGTMEEGESRRYTGAPGGSFTFNAPHALVRRHGSGTITLAAGSANFSVAGGALLSEIRAGEQVEVAGQRATVQSVTDNTNAVLVAPWPGVNVPAIADWSIVPLVTVYLVTVSKAGTRRSDIENAPHVEVLFDGDLSAPVAPTILAATSMGNTIRLDIQQPVGTALRRLHIYRATGATQPFSACVERDSIALNTTLVSSAAGIITWSDEKFSTFEREQGQVFSYYVTVDNVRGDASPPSTRAEAAARLDAPGDGSPTIPAGSNPKNLIFNSFPFGTVGGTVSLADVHQDDYMGGAADTDNRPSGGPDFRGYYRMEGASSGGGATPPGHDSATEIVIPAPGALNAWSVWRGRVGAWDNATLARRRIDKGRNLTLAVFMRSSSPTPPNGSITMHIAMMSAGSDVGYYAVKNRVSTDLFDYSEVIRGGAVSGHTILGTVLAYPNANVLYATFSPQTIPVSVDQIEWRVTHWDTTNGNNLFVTKIWLGYGDQLAAWTPELVLSQFPPPTAAVPGPLPDRDGSRLGWSRIP